MSGRQDAVAQALGDRVLATQTHVSNGAAVQTMFDTAVGRFGRVDGAVHCAAISGHTGPLAEITEDACDRVIAVNLRGTFLCASTRFG